MNSIGDSNTPSTLNEDKNTISLSSNEESESRSQISDLKKLHFKEITELRNQLDEITTRATILEATKQDELDEIRSKATLEIDSLNHIINTLQNDLSQLRNEYENLSTSYRDIKKQNHNLTTIMQQQQQQSQPLQLQQFNSNNEIKSPTPSSQSSRLALSPFGHHHHNNNNDKHYNHNISQENENLEEDMRKAKESADMLRSVVLPLETEINTLRTRSNTADKRIKELEMLVEQNERDKNEMLDEEKKLIDEILNNQSENNDLSVDQQATTSSSSVMVRKYLLMRNYLKKSENKFIDLERQNLKSIQQIYALLSREQKLNLIPNRPKSKSFTKQKNETNDSNVEQMPQDEISIEKNEIISKIEELLNYLTSNETNPSDEKTLNLVINSYDSNNSTATNATNTSNDTNKSLLSHSFAELLAMYDREKELRIDIETNFHHKAKESNRQIENLNREMSNLASIIEDLRKQYNTLQNQYQFQIDSLIKLNEEIRNDMHQIETKIEKYKSENLRLKAENKQFYGEQTILSKELDQTYQKPSNLEEAFKQLESLRAEMVKLVIANQALNKQCNLSTESIRHLKDLNLKYQRSNNLQDQIVITQSLESELERERKVRLEAEQEKSDAMNQLKLVKDRGQTIVEQLKHRNELSELEIKKLKEENQELLNQISSLKKDSKNNLSVQEDLVKLIQSLQIELNQFKTEYDANKNPDGSNKPAMIEVRCQNEDDFNDCASCKNVFSVTKRKHRCKHCCKIFCAECCAKTVYSGPNLRPHKVCDSCHTLLDKDSSRPPITNSTS